MIHWPAANLVKSAGLLRGKKRISAHSYERRDMQAWDALAGVLKGKKAINAVKWQKEIRKEWERKLPKFK